MARPGLHSALTNSPHGTLNVVYRDIFPEDVPAVDELQRQLFPVRYSEGFYQRLFTDGHYTVLAATPDGAIIGIASARTVSDEAVGSRSDHVREGYIMTLGVQESFRRLGIGAELLRRILVILRSLACTVAALHVKSLNVAACRFYECHGFRPDPVNGWYPGHYLIDGVQYDAYRLICPLSSSWVTWLATKLGLAEPSAGAISGHRTGASAHRGWGQQQLHWPVAQSNSSLPPRQARLAAPAHDARLPSGGLGGSAQQQATPERNAGYQLRAPWQ